MLVNTVQLGFLFGPHPKKVHFFQCLKKSAGTKVILKYEPTNRDIHINCFKIVIFNLAYLNKCLFYFQH